MNICVRGSCMRKTALIVDDEPLVRSFITHVLKMLDFKILEADTEETAYKLFNERKEEIVFIITEIDLIFGNGLNLFKRIREVSKSVVIVVCGDCMEYPFQEMLADPCAAVLVKPYSIDTLIRTTNMVNMPIPISCSL